MRKTCLSATFLALVAASLLAAAGCGAPEPDTSAPDRVEISRSADWNGALLYIADETGPTPDWGSIRIYDNVSGFVEETVEQTLAAGPADVYVTPDGSTMYVASISNGRIDEFHWDGNGWNHGSGGIDSPASSLLTLVPGPGGKLYAADGDPMSSGDFYVFNPDSGRFDTDEKIPIPGLDTASGIAWTMDGSQALVCGTDRGAPTLVKVTWPGMETVAASAIPLPRAHQVVTTDDGAYAFVMGGGAVIKMDTASLSVVATLRPSGNSETVYYDAALSTDGHYLFTAGTDPGKDSTLYIIELAGNGIVRTVPHVSARANGIQRVQ